MEYNEEKIQEIVTYLEDGNSRRTAYELAGIHADTFYEWMKGNIPEKVLADCKTEEERTRRKAEFSERVIRALAEGKRKHIQNIGNCAMGIRQETVHPDGSRTYGNFIIKPDWKASAELLKMVHKDEFADRKEIVGVENEGQPLTVKIFTTSFGSNGSTE